MNKNQILDKLRKINKKGLAYEKIARELNVSTQSVYRWLNDINPPSSLALDKIREYVTDTSKTKTL